MLHRREELGGCQGQYVLHTHDDMEAKSNIVMITVCYVTDKVVDRIYDRI